jgi:hypothetical protein
MEINMKVDGKKEIKAEKEKLFVLMEIHMKEIGSMEKKKVKVLSF